jgi:protein-S-isoprenylcysteine O-methyltransferase Ste14
MAATANLRCAAGQQSALGSVRLHRAWLRDLSSQRVLGLCNDRRGNPHPHRSPATLVVSGLHRFVRNPMYIGVLLVAGQAWLFWSRSLFLYAALLWLAFHLFVLIYEEPILQKQFGESYERYRAGVPRWIPKIRL